MNPIYQALEIISSPFIVNYRNDLLVHDREALGNYSGPFLHYTRANGTYLDLMMPVDHPLWPAPGVAVPYLFGMATREHILSQSARSGEYIQKREGGVVGIIQHFNGSNLKVVSLEEAITISNQYRASVELAWRARTRIAV